MALNGEAVWGTLAVFDDTRVRLLLTMNIRAAHELREERISLGLQWPPAYCLTFILVLAVSA